MEIVHIVGHSCAGKRSLIEMLCDPTHQQLRKRFGISGTTEAYLDKGYAAGSTPFTRLAWRPTSELLTAKFDHMLHKWQFLPAGEVERLSRDRPEIGHRVIVLWRTCTEMVERITRKGAWNPPPSISYMRSEMKKLYDTIQPWVESGLNVEYVQAGTPLYDVLPDFPLED